MPTGYTYIIEKGCTFEEYVWSCARAFGALVEMRDEPPNAPIPTEFKPSPYYPNKIEALKKELAWLQSADMAEITARVEKELAETIEQNKKYREEHVLKAQRYTDMRKMVSAWDPPSPDHVEMKEFMLSQIDLCIDHGEPYQRKLPVSDPAEWVEIYKEQLNEDLNAATKSYLEELERVKDRNAWIKALRESVPQPRVEE